MTALGQSRRSAAPTSFRHPQASGAHEAFLTELLEAADDVADFDATADPEELRDRLAPGA
jgi:hypothetical protein